MLDLIGNTMIGYCSTLRWAEVLHKYHHPNSFLLFTQKNYSFLIFSVYFCYFSFSAMTLLVGRQKRHPVCKETERWFVGGCWLLILTEALHVLLPIHIRRL